jgi:hypothetical protein
MASIDVASIEDGAFAVDRLYGANVPMGAMVAVQLYAKQATSVGQISAKLSVDLVLRD